MWQCIECEHENSKSLSSCEKCATSRPSSSLIGESISQWVIESELGEGGMAVVFGARHKMLGSPVAIKVLRADMLNKREVVERFKTEALAASHLSHENVIQVHDFGTQPGIGVYMVLEFLDGMDLEEKLEDTPLPLPWVMNITKQVCSGLEAAHNAGIIHRDLKPSNIYLVPRKDHDIPLAKILDFGIAKIQESQLFEGQQKLTRTGTVLGTPYYLSPEQLRRREKQELGASVDIYALGVILYQLLAGRLPIEEPTLAEQMAAILTKTPRLIGTYRPDLEGSSLELLLARLLSKNPDDRPASIAEVWAELEKAAGAFNDPEIDAALRQQWKQVYKTPTLEELGGNPQPSFFKQYGLTLILISLLVGCGGYLGYILLKDSKSTAVADHRTKPGKRIQTPKWMDLNNQGLVAYNSGDNLRAFKLWQASLKELNAQGKKRGGTRKNQKKLKQELVQNLAIASQRSARFYNALHFARQLSTFRELSPDERKELQARIYRLQNKLKNAEKVLGTLADAVRNGIKHKKKYKFASRAYQILLAHKDKSSPVPYVKAAQSLEKNLPAQALVLYNKAHSIALSSKDKNRIDSQRSAVKNRVLSQRQAMQILLKEPSRKRRFKRSFKRILMAQVSDAQLHSMVIGRIQSLAHTDLRTATWLLSLYQQTLKQMHRKSALSWLKETQSKTSIPTAQSLDNTLTFLRKRRRVLRNIERMNQKTQRLLKRGRMSQMLGMYKKRQEAQQAYWSELAQIKGPLQSKAKQKLTQLQKSGEQSLQVQQLWKRVKEHHERDELVKAEQSYQKILELYKDSSEVTSGFTNQYKKWSAQHTRASQYIVDGEKAAQRKRWTGCKYLFDRYLRTFPKSNRKEVIRLKRCKCRCKLPAPFEPCSEQCKLPYK